MSARIICLRVLQRPLLLLTSRSCSAVRTYNIFSSSLNPAVSKLYIPNLQTYRSKKKKKGKEQIEMEDSDDETQEDEDNRDDGDEYIAGTKTVIIKIPNYRIDRILKSVYGHKNEVDDAFLGGKIRRNDEKVLKKGLEVYEGDVLDIVKGIDENNPNRIRVFRAEILDLQNHGSTVQFKIRVSRDLLIKDYDTRVDV